MSALTRLRTLIPPTLTIMTMACSACGGDSPSKAAPASTQGAASPAATQTPSRTAAAANVVEGRDYTVLQRTRFMDASGFEQPAEAFSVLLPRGWKHEGGVVWKSLQACRGEMVGARWSVSSPDGAIRYEARPIHAWGSASDPMMTQTLHMQQRQGGCEVGGIVDATQYMREVFAPRELAGAVLTDVRENEPATREMRRQADTTLARLAQYSGGGRMEVVANAAIARVQWPDRSEGIAFVSVLNIVTTVSNPFTGSAQRLTNSHASERSVIRFPADRRQEAETVLATLKSSHRTNPRWKEAIDGYFERMRQQQDALHHQRMDAIAIQTAANARAHAQRMADIQRQGEANTQRFAQRMADMDQSLRTWEAQQSSQDRMHTAFVQTIREVQTWQGGDGRVELSSGYDHAWSRGDGTYIVSNSPSFDPRSVFLDQNWQELKRADP